MVYKLNPKNIIVEMTNTAKCGKNSLGEPVKVDKLSPIESLNTCEKKKPRRWNPANVSHIIGGSIVNVSLTVLLRM